MACFFSPCFPSFLRASYLFLIKNTPSNPTPVKGQYTIQNRLVVMFMIVVSSEMVFFLLQISMIPPLKSVLLLKSLLLRAHGPGGSGLHLSEHRLVVNRTPSKGDSRVRVTLLALSYSVYLTSIVTGSLPKPLFPPQAPVEAPELRCTPR